MDDLRLNKYIAGLLCGGLLIMAGIKSADLLLPHHTVTTDAYPIEALEEAATGGTAASAAKGPQPILALLADADIAAGERLSKKCTSCHTFTQGGANKVGPNLWGIVNASRSQVAGFSYSSAFTELGGAWSYTELNGFLHKPKAWVKGTKMTYAGMRKPQDRANIIAWMRTLAGSPAPLPSEAEIASEADAASEAEAAAAATTQ